MTIKSPDGLIDVRVDDPSRLFEPFDAAPLGHQHLNEGVERFIMHCADGARHAKYTLIIHSPRDPRSSRDVATLGNGIRDHFAHRAKEETGKLQAMINEGKRDLVIGLFFLFLCGLAGAAAMRLLPVTIAPFVEQGLLIIGWVALWRPVDIFLYELRPLRNRRAVLSSLSRADVLFQE